MQYDLLLKGGMLIDSTQGIHAIKDIAFKDGTVAEVGDDLDVSSVTDVIDCSGSIVSPGWIDLHVHAFWGCSHYGIDPDPHLVANGVTTALDAGSAGAD
ncbi:MAG: amidohydrolase/deacetylase family metallohydrolase, partial [Deltaproteobacteria bacterium]|nr:amidohydrolase/deacetylase family metallohydrolase [Deltaproteobacteria bacterium]